MKILTLFIISIFFFFVFSFDTFAKTLPQAKTGQKISTVKPVTTTNISVSVKLRRDRKALTVYFGNLKNASNVSYVLTYKTNGRSEGAGGSVRPSDGNNTNRELLFGTCSKTVCTYHQNITEMKLEVTGQLKSGKTFLKRYRVKA